MNSGADEKYRNNILSSLFRKSNQNMFRHITMWQRLAPPKCERSQVRMVNKSRVFSHCAVKASFPCYIEVPMAMEVPRMKNEICAGLTYSHEFQFDSIPLKHFTEPIAIVLCQYWISTTVGELRQLERGKMYWGEMKSSDWSDEHTWQVKLYWWLHILPEKSCYDCSTMRNH